MRNLTLLNLILATKVIRRKTPHYKDKEPYEDTQENNSYLVVEQSRV